MQQNQTKKSLNTIKGGESPELPYDTPDYLGLEPQLPKSNRFSNRRKVIVFFSIFLTVLMAGAAGYWWWQQNTPEALFYRALENSLQTKYVKRQIEYKSLKNTTTTNLTTDLADPRQPKSSLQSVVSNNNKAVFGLKTIVPSKQQYFFLIEFSDPGVFAESLKRNTWYRAPFHAAGRKEVGYWIDTVWSPLTLNSAQGILPFGALSLDQRVKLINYIRSNGVYPFVGTQSRTENGTKFRVYNISVDLDKINNLNNQIDTLLGTSLFMNISKPYPKYQELQFWINESTDQFSKIIYNSGKSKDSIETKITGSYTYPDRFSIDTPPGVKEVPS